MEQDHRPYASGFIGRPFVQIKTGPANGQKIAKGDWSTTSFYYLDKPFNSLPAIQDVIIRTKGFK